MKFTRRDAGATTFIGLAVVTFVATHEGWGVPLVGSSHRWATGAILVLGLLAATTGATRSGSALFALLGGTALVLGVLAFATGSLTPLSFLVIDLVTAWALATWRHTHLHSTPAIAA